MQLAIQQAAELIHNSKNLIAFAGAGLSAESGIPTFRGDEGIWKKYPPIIYGNLPGLALSFALRPKRFREFVSSAVSAFVKAEPNPGHLALGELFKRGLLKAVITQNIDDLERRAGVKEVIQLHGSIYKMRCLRCKRIFEISRERLLEALTELEKLSGRWSLVRFGRALSRCPECKGNRRPDIVFFGEGLNPSDYQRAIALARGADLMLILGTSGVVYPAGLIPSYAHRAGAKIIEINPEPTVLSHLAEIEIKAQSAEALPQIVKLL